MKRKLYVLSAIVGVLVLATSVPVGLGLQAALGAGKESPKAEGGAPTVKREASENIAIAYAVAISISIACFSAGLAVGKVGAAAFGAAAERPELLGRAIIFVGLAEGIAIYGLVIAIMLWRLL